MGHIAGARGMRAAGPEEGRSGARSRAAARPGSAAELRRQEAQGGGAAGRAQLGAAGERLGQRLGRVGGPPGREAGNREAALLAGRRGRRETPDGLGAPPASCGGSRSQSGARAQTSGRQRTPASGPQGPRGEPARAGGGRGRGRGGAAGSARGHVAEAPPRPPASSLCAEWLCSCWAGSGRRAPWAASGGQEPQEVLGCSPGSGEEWWLGDMGRPRRQIIGGWPAQPRLGGAIEMAFSSGHHRVPCPVSRVPCPRHGLEPLSCGSRAMWTRASYFACSKSVLLFCVGVRLGFFVFYKVKNFFQMSAYQS